MANEAAAAAAAGAGGRRPSLSDALNRQTSAQRAQHAIRVANHPLAPPQATCCRAVGQTLLNCILLLIILLSFITDPHGFHAGCPNWEHPAYIGVWLQVLYY